MKFVFSIGLWIGMILPGYAQVLTSYSMTGFAGFKSEGRYQVINKDPFGYTLSSSFMSPYSKPSGTMYGVNHLPGLFCRLEYKLEQKSRLAPRFRLGSLRYTEWFEGKTSPWLEIQ